MLRRFHAGRFAHNRPPEGERRLLRFADHQTGQNPLDPEAENMNAGQTPGEQESPIGAILQETSAETLRAAPETVAGFDDAARSSELLQALLDRPGPAEAKLKMILTQRLGQQEALVGMDPLQMDPQELRFALKESLRDYPDVTLKLARLLEDRIRYFQKDGELYGSIERKVQAALGKTFVIKDEHKKILEHRDANGHPKFPEEQNALRQLERLAKVLESIPNERLSSVCRLLETNAKGDLGGRAIAEELGWIDAEHPEQFASLNADQRSVLLFLGELKRTHHRTFFAAAPHEGEIVATEEYVTRRQTYLEGLEAQKQALFEFLHTQIQEESGTVLKRHYELAQALIRELKGNDGELTTAEINERLLARKGYGYEALKVALDLHAHPLGTLLKEEVRKKGTTTLKSVGTNHAAFLSHAERALRILFKRKPDAAEDLPMLLEHRRIEQEDTDRWAYETAQYARQLHGLPDGPRKAAVERVMQKSKWRDLTALHDFFEPSAYLHDDRDEYLRLVAENPSCRILATDPEFSLDERRRLTALLLALHHDPFQLLKGEEDYAALKQEERTFEQLDDADILARIVAVRASLQTVFEEIRTSSLLNHQVADTLALGGQLQDRKDSIEGLMVSVLDEQGKPVMTPQLKHNIPLAGKEVQYLQDVRDRLNMVKDGHIQYRELDPRIRGHFRDGQIVINTARPAHSQKSALYHEQGHAVLWAFSAAFPLLLAKEMHALGQTRIGPQGESFEQLLRGLREFAPYQDLAEQMDTWKEIARARFASAAGHEPDVQELADETDRVYMEQMLDELVTRHAEWAHISGKREDTNPSGERQQELLLFAQLEKGKGGIFEELAGGKNNIDVHALADVQPELLTAGAKFARVEEHEEEETLEATGMREAGTKTINVHSELREVRREIEVMESFLEAYPETSEVMTPQIQKAETLYRELSQKFLTMKDEDPDSPEFKAFLNRVIALRRYTMTIHKKIRELDVEMLDISQVPRSKAPGFFDGIRFMSVLDIIKFGKDTLEDINSIYKRRQDRLLKDVGAVAADALGVGKHIPYIGEYFAGLRGYHERRYSNTDVEAAKKWEDSMKFIDSHKVLDMLSRTNDKDLLRGGIGLLVERGDMDWNHRGVWGTLQRMSGYRMPEEACLRDDVLRDTWLRKMINDIWKDKEQYYHWRQHNDSAIDKNKKDFTPTADQLANVSGGLSNELRKQLKLYVEWNKDHSQPVPDDIKPHLYEEVLHYAMRNGKMRMEDKFFYLVQGVRHGIMSIDRLRVLAGEGGEILLRFPFIDYFYGRNNSMDEVRRLGERLEESGDGEDEYKPGAKTMCFLQYELPEEESFQYRLSKALGRDNIEKIDHEDFPMIVGLINYNKIKDITGILSGERFKITTESVKNSYVGFNSRFKAFARLADMEQAKLARFSSSDARNVAMSLTSFIHYDNIITRKGWDGTNRQSLTWHDINHTTAPSSGNLIIKVFRDGALSLAHDLINELARAGAFDWDAVIGGRKVGDRNLRKDELFSQMGEEFQSDSKPTDAQTAAFNSIPALQKELEKALMARPDVMKAVLRKHGDRQAMPQNYLMEEGASDVPGGEYMTLEKTSEYFKKLAEEERVGRGELAHKHGEEHGHGH